MTNCLLCQSSTTVVGEKPGGRVKRNFTLRHCQTCGFYFVENPELDFQKVYDEAYYDGRGADPLINYNHEIESFSTTVRNYEWLGITKYVQSCLGKLDGLTWLDYGCGTGGLVRFCNENLPVKAHGFDQSLVTEKALIPVLSEAELEKCQGTFDVITAIEVLEHCIDPLTEFAKLRRLLKPGGLLFCTTGNTAPFESTILDWSYYVPDIHVSLFQPKTLKYCLEKSGFRAENYGFQPGFESIIRFKVLKVLKMREMNILEKMVPWSIASKIIETKFKLSDFPVGRG